MRGKCVTLRVGVVTVSRPKQAAGNSFRFRRSWSCDSENPPTSQASMLGLGFVKERNLLRFDWLGFRRLV